MTEAVSGLHLTLAGRPGAVACAVTTALAHRGWDIPPLEAPYSHVSAPEAAPPFALLFDAGLIDSPIPYPGAVSDLEAAISRAFDRDRSTPSTVGRVVILSSRDGLGWPDRVSAAATAGALAAATRSLALKYGPRGITVNLIAGLPEGDRHRGCQGSGGWAHPTPLLPDFPGPEEIAAAAHFFLHPRSGYITGQIFHCCGGASLLSSLSV